MTDFELNAEEKAFIRKLKNATKNIPPRLWLLTAESGLHVMARTAEGDRATTVFDGFDQSYILDTITDDISSGAW